MAKNRQQINKELHRILGELINKYPNLRFGQTLVNFNFINEKGGNFYEEPDKTLSKVLQSVALANGVDISYDK